MPFRFYSLFTLLLVALVVLWGRDFGPMLRAERRARGGKVLRDGARPLVRDSAFELAPAACAEHARASRACSALDAARGAWTGVRSSGTALALLLLSWMLGAVCRDLGTATYLCVLVQEALNPLLLPIVLFGISGLLAFATGSPWSTMTILLPLVVGVSFEAGRSTPIGGEGMVVVAIASVLEGAIFGDHCSPVSDTTVMSSMGSACDHVDHVRTQAPYAPVRAHLRGLAAGPPAPIPSRGAPVAGSSPYALRRSAQPAAGGCDVGSRDDCPQRGLARSSA